MLHPLEVIKVAPTFMRVVAPPSSGRLMIAFLHGLLVVEERKFLHALTLMNQIDLDHAPGKLFQLPKLEPDDAWDVNPRTDRLAILREKCVELIALSEPDKKTVIAIPSLPDGAYGACVNDDESSLLGQTTYSNDIDFQYFAPYLLDLRRGVVALANEVLTSEPMRTVWCPKARIFLMWDDDKKRLWRWKQGVPRPEPLNLPKVPGRDACLFFVQVTSETLSVGLVDDATNAVFLATGTLSTSGVEWRSEVKLPPGEYHELVCHPNRNLWACRRDIELGALLCVINSEGEVVAEETLPDSCIGHGLTWSSDGQVIYAVGDDALTTWKVPLEEN